MSLVAVSLVDLDCALSLMSMPTFLGSLILGAIMEMGENYRRNESKGRIECRKKKLAI